MTLPFVSTPSLNTGSASLRTSHHQLQLNTITSSTTTPELPNQTSEAESNRVNSPATLPQSTSHDPPSLSTTHRVIVTRCKHNIHKPIQKLNLTAELNHPVLEPTTFTQALKDPNWRLAMSEEFDALLRNGTWELVPSHPNQNLVGCKWVFRTKYLPNGCVDRYKARLVANGFHQRPGIDYSETFSPVIKPSTVCLVLSLAVFQGWSLRQLDINNAFLQGTLTEDVFMSQPPGFIDPDFPNHVCKLRKAIYGLKQAPRAWYHELRQFLLQYGFNNSIADTSLFISTNISVTIYVLVYVDDIIITGNTVGAVQDFITKISQRFSLKDLGPLTYFLGVEVTPTQDGLFLSQRKYISDLLTRTHMSQAKPALTPLATSPTLTLRSGSPLSNPTECRAVVGSLQYLSITRPDIAYTVNKLCQFMHQPTADHWSAVKRLLRYLCGTLDHGISLFGHLHFLFMRFRMLIGQATKMIIPPLVDT